MKVFVRELIGDFKAAVRIGDPDSAEAVMDRVRAASEDSLPASALLPLGEAVRTLPDSVLFPWLDEEDAGVRGIAAAALGLQLASGAAVPEAVTRIAAGDPADEVRTALVEGLTSGQDFPADLADLFLSDKAPEVRRTGLLLLHRSSGLALHSLERLAWADLEQDHGFRNDLVDTLNRLAENGLDGPVLDLLATWAARAEPNTWLVTRVVSAGWAQEHSARCLAILNNLQEQTGEKRAIARARERHQTP